MGFVGYVHKTNTIIMFFIIIFLHHYLSVSSVCLTEPSGEKCFEVAY